MYTNTHILIITLGMNRLSMNDTIAIDTIEVNVMIAIMIPYMNI
jgi:hypothetical protein